MKQFAQQSDETFCRVRKVCCLVFSIETFLLKLLKNVIFLLILYYCLAGGYQLARMFKAPISGLELSKIGNSFRVFQFLR